MNTSEDSVTILKYRVGEVYNFAVYDKFDERDEAKRLDLMIELSRSMQEFYGDRYEQLWIKTCPIFAIR